MITGEIKIHDEPYTTYGVTTYYNNKPDHTTEEQKAAWEKKCIDDLEKAKNIFTIGDTIETLHAQNGRLTILEFIEDPANMQRYNGNPCVVKCINKAYTKATSIQYSLPELNLKSLIKQTILGEQNDCGC